MNRTELMNRKKGKLRRSWLLTLTTDDHKV